MIRKSQVAHIAHGLAAGFLTGLYEWFGLLVAAFLYIQFIAYEFVEETKIRDEMYYELKEWGGGYIVGLLLTLVFKELMGGI